MFLTRLLSGAVLLLIAFASFWVGAPLLPAVLFLVSAVGYLELTKALGVREKTNGKLCALEIVGLVAVAVYYTLLLFCDMEILGGDKFFYCLLGIALMFLAELFVYVIRFPKYEAEPVIAAVFAFLYAPVMLSFIDMTRMHSDGKRLVWLILISSWGCDTCAYCVGKLIGKKKIFPVLSPKKSLEGCIGGVLGAALIGVIYVACLGTREPRTLCLIAVICAFGGAVSMLGDLAASAIKRNKGIKDYGKLIPGHGGIMDRFDSVIVTAPLTYFMVVLLLGM